MAVIGFFVIIVQIPILKTSMCINLSLFVTKLNKTQNLNSEHISVYIDAIFCKPYDGFLIIVPGEGQRQCENKKLKWLVQMFFSVLLHLYSV